MGETNGTRGTRGTLLSQSRVDQSRATCQNRTIRSNGFCQYLTCQRGSCMVRNIESVILSILCRMTIKYYDVLL